MALASAMVWEVRGGTGADTNGGGFKAGAAGVDYSQQAAAQKSGTDLAIHASDTTKIQPVAAGVSANDVGNTVQITAGSGFTTGTYEITAQDGTYWTVDRSAGTASSSGGTYAMGGALAGVAKAATVMVGQNKCYVKAATYLITTTITPATGVQAAPTTWIGYNAARGDLDSVADFSNFPTIEVNNAAITVFTCSNSFSRIRNFVLDGGTAGTKGTRGVSVTANYGNVDNCKATRFSAYGFLQTGTVGSWFRRCLVTGLQSGAVAGFSMGSGTLEYSRATANPCDGVTITAAASIHRCIFDANTGAGSDGIIATAPQFIVRECVCHGNGQDGIGILGAGDYAVISDCILSDNTGWGIRNSSGTALVDQPCMNYNAFYSNGSGTVSGVPAGANDVSLSGDPFTNAGAGDFSLNATAGAGADCRGTGFPGVMPGATTTGYADIGVAQHADPVSSGGSAVAVFGS